MAKPKKEGREFGLGLSRKSRRTIEESKEGFGNDGDKKEGKKYLRKRGEPS